MKIKIKLTFVRLLFEIEKNICISTKLFKNVFLEYAWGSR